MKKDMLKILLISGLGLFVAILGYPFLHELGHILASAIVGADVLNLTLFPIPSVLCDVSGVSENGLVIIGFGGLVLPTVCSLLIPRKWFVSWYLRTLLQGMSAFAAVVSFVSVLFGINPQDDMIQVLKFWEYGNVELLLILLFCSISLCLMIAFDSPGRRIYKYFEI